MIGLSKMVGGIGSVATSAVPILAITSPPLGHANGAVRGGQARLTLAALCKDCGSVSVPACWGWPTAGNAQTTAATQSVQTTHGIISILGNRSRSGRSRRQHRCKSAARSSERIALTKGNFCTFVPPPGTKLI
jgi:hypothetical protein